MNENVMGVGQENSNNEVEENKVEAPRDTREVGREVLDGARDKAEAFFNKARSFIGSKVAGFAGRVQNYAEKVGLRLQSGLESASAAAVGSAEHIVGTSVLQAEQMGKRASELQQNVAERIGVTSEKIGMSCQTLNNNFTEKIQGIRMNREVKALLDKITLKTGIDLRDANTAVDAVEDRRTQQINAINQQADQLAASRLHAEALLNRFKQIRNSNV